MNSRVNLVNFNNFTDHNLKLQDACCKMKNKRIVSPYATSSFHENKAFVLAQIHMYLRKQQFND